MKTSTVLIIFVLTLTMSCEKIHNSSYLDEWLGVYEGTSHHWDIYSVSTNNIVSTHEYKKVLAEVGEGDLDSTLNLTLTFDSTITFTHSDLKFSASGHHFSVSGGGSGVASITIKFDTDSMHYNSFKKCGMPCSASIDFSIKKKQ